jgi:hypothetical protein
MCRGKIFCKRTPRRSLTSSDNGARASVKDPIDVTVGDDRARDKPDVDKQVGLLSVPDDRQIQPAKIVPL